MRNSSAYTDFASSGSLLFQSDSRSEVTLSYCYSLHYSQHLIQNYIADLQNQLHQLEHNIHHQRAQLRPLKSNVDCKAEELYSELRHRVSAYCFNRTGMEKLIDKMGVDSSPEGFYSHQQLVESLIAKQEALQNRDQFYSELVNQIIKKILAYVAHVGVSLTEERMLDYQKQLRLLLDQKCSWDGVCESVLSRFEQECELNKDQIGRVAQLLCTLMANRFREAVEQINAVQNCLRRSAAKSSRFRKDFFTKRYSDFLMFLVESEHRSNTSVMKDVQWQFSMLLQGHLNERHAHQLFLALGGFDIQLSPQDQSRLLFLMANAERVPQLASTDYPERFYDAGKESPEHARIISRCINQANNVLQVNKGSPAPEVVFDAVTGESISTVEDGVAARMQCIELSFRTLEHNVSRRTSLDSQSICNTVPRAIAAHHDGANGLSFMMNQVNRHVADIVRLRKKQEEIQKKIACAQKLLDVMKYSVCQAIGTYLNSTRQNRQACRWWTMRNRHSQYGRRRAQALYQSVYQTGSIEQLQLMIRAEMLRASKSGIKGWFDSRSRCNKQSLNMYLIVAMSTLSHHVLNGARDVDSLMTKIDRYKNAGLERPQSQEQGAQRTDSELLCDGLTNTLTPSSLLFNHQLDRVVSQRRGESHAVFYNNKKQLARHCSEIFGSWDRRRRLSSSSRVASLLANRTA